MRGSLLIYKEWNPLIQSLPKEKRLRFYDILFTYEDDSSLPEIKDPHLKSVLDFVLNKVKDNDVKYEAKCQKAKESAELRWSKNAKTSKRMRTHTKVKNAMHNDNDNDNEFTSVNKKKSEKENFSPPTLFEVEEYFDTNGFDRAVAFRAYNGYAVADWVDSKGNRIRNWKQKMQQVWFKPEHQKKQELAELDADEVAKFYGR